MFISEITPEDLRFTLEIFVMRYKNTEKYLKYRTFLLKFVRIKLITYICHKIPHYGKDKR